MGNTSTGFGAGAGGGFGLNKPGFGPEVHHFAAKSDSEHKTVEVKPEIAELWKKVLDDEQPETWIVCEYVEGSKEKIVELKSSGTSGLEAFKAALPTDSLAWGGFRCYGVDKRGDVDCKRAKFVFVQWSPEGISQIKKARVAPHKGEVNGAIDCAHLDLMVESSAELEPNNLITKLQAATGAHKPNGYEFEEGVFCEADFYGLGIGKDCKGESEST